MFLIESILCKKYNRKILRGATFVKGCGRKFELQKNISFRKIKITRKIKLTLRINLLKLKIEKGYLWQKLIWML
ncbi:MAG: hypothetical protein A2Y10_07210 [Planctomycetes bacterium GWF2_41_51]|nr:MAG: hypothetical protein A2Y10_07210 [Planctomycetes bacterium GWF2_41_51]HBG28517.1 hypothetical protein [Phycisphaerales bacterium]